MSKYVTVSTTNTWDTKYVTVSNTWAIKDTVTSYFTKCTLCSELDTMVAGDVEGDVGEQLVEEAVDHRHDDDARTAALRHQLRHLLLHQHHQRGWTKFVFHHLSS